MDFKYVFFGQSCLKYKTPVEVFAGLTEIYEKKKKQLPKANKQLVGKIEDEVSLFFDGPPNERMRTHSFLPVDILKWFESIFRHYLEWNKIKEYKLHISSIWINEMKAGEYNPVHIHQGKIFTGLSSVMILKLPKDMGPEIVRPDQPMNGQLQILGSAAGQFVTADYSPKMKIGDFYIFPYDVRHVVYPFTNKKVKRRTLVCNCDVDYNPITTRTAQ